MSKFVSFESVAGMPVEQALHVDSTSIDKLVLTMASSEEIAAMSVLDIQPPFSEADQKMLERLKSNEERFDLHWHDVPLVSSEAGAPQMRTIQQLNHALLGSTEYNSKCATCDRTSSNCGGDHEASHSLHWPVYHIGYINNVLNLLRICCFFCSRILSPILSAFPLPSQLPSLRREEGEGGAHDNSPFNDIGNGLQWQVFWEKASSVILSLAAAEKSNVGRFCDHCKMPQPYFKLAHKDAIATSWMSSYHPDFKGDGKNESSSSAPWQPSPQLLRHFAGTVKKVIMQYRDEPALSRDTESPCGRGAECATFGRLLNCLLALDYASLTEEAKWILKAIAFINPVYRRRMMRIPMTAAKASAIFRDMQDEDVLRIGMHPIVNHPTSMIWTVMPVAVKGLRPYIAQLSGTETVRQDPITVQYCSIMAKSAAVRHQATKCYVKTMRLLNGLVASGRLEEEVVRRYNAVPAWQWSDMRACWFDGDMSFQEALSDLQHEINVAISYKAVASKSKQNHNSGRKGAKNAASGTSIVSSLMSKVVAKAKVFIDANAALPASSQASEGATNSTKTTVSKKRKRSQLQASSSSASLPPLLDAVKPEDAMEISADVVASDGDAQGQCACCEEFVGDEDRMSDYLSKSSSDLDPALKDAANITELGVTFHANPNAVPSRSAAARRKAAMHNAAAIAATKIDGPYITAQLPEYTISQYGKKLKPSSFIDSLATKQGDFRQHMNCKRSDFTIRKVLGANCRLAIDQIGVSLVTCIVETVPVKVTLANIELIQWMVANGSGITCGVERIDTGADEGRSIAVPKVTLTAVDKRDGADDEDDDERNLDCNEYDEYVIRQSYGRIVPWIDPRHVMLEIGWTVHIYTQDGQYCILNRQPSLHKANHTAHRSKRLFGRIFSLCENAMPQQNADTDGDTVTGSNRQSIPSRVEVAFKMNAPNNIIDPRTHRPITTLHQNSLHGVYLLCREDCFLSKEEACFIASHVRKVQPLRQYLTRHLGFARSASNASGRVSLEDAAFATSYFFTDDEMALKSSCLPLSDEQRSAQLAGTSGWTEQFLPPPYCQDEERGPLWRGRDLIAMILPADLEFKKFCGDVSPAEFGSLKEAVNDKEHRFVWIHGGKWICGEGGNELFGVVQNGLIQHLWRYYGKQFSCDVMSDWGFMAHAYLALEGVTCGTNDVMLGGVLPSDTGVIMKQLFGDENASSDLVLSNFQSHDDAQIAFREAVRQYKDDGFAVLDKGFDYVYQFMSQPDVYAHLNQADVKMARQALQSYAESMFKYNSSFTASVTDQKRNQVSLMKDSKCKGSNSNTTTMAACLPMAKVDGEQFAIGEQISPNTRIMPSEIPGSITPRTLGVISHGFVDGLRPDEMLKHSRVTWEKVFSSADPTKSGAQQRRMKTHSESETVHNGGTLRNGKEIVQILYGGDGYDACMVMQIRLSPSDLLMTSNHQTKSHPVDYIDDVVSICHRDMDLERLAWLKAWRAQNACDTCEACARLHQYRAYHVSQFLHERATDPFNEWQSTEDMRRRGTRVHITVNARVIVSTHQAQWLRNFKDGGLNDEERPVSHEVWCREVMGLCKSIISFTSQMSHPIDVIVHVLSVLHRQHEEFDFSLATERDMMDLFHDIYMTYCESFAEPGSAWGSVASQSISENATQATLRAFRMDVNVSDLGNDDMDALLGAKSDKSKFNGNVCQCAISPLWASSMDDAEFLVSQIKCTMLKDWVESESVKWIFHSDDDAPAGGDFVSDRDLIAPTHPLYFTLQTLIGASYAMSDKRDLPFGSAVMLFTLHPSLFLSNGESHKTSKFTMQRRLDRTLLPFQRGVIIGGPDVHVDAPFYWCVWQVMNAAEMNLPPAEERPMLVRSQMKCSLTLSRMMKEHLVVSGSSTIKSCLSIKPPATPLSPAELRMAEHGYLELLPCHCYIAELEGSDILSVMSHPATVDRYCTSSDLNEIRSLFDLDVVSQPTCYAMNKLQGNGEGSYVQPRHTQLIVDTMMTEGQVTAINRAGLGKKRNTGFVSEMAFENASSVILNASVRGRVDMLEQNMGNVMLGKPLPFIGTGIVKVLPALSALDNCKDASDTYAPSQRGESIARPRGTPLSAGGRDFNVESAMCSNDQLVTKFIDFIDRSSSFT